MIWKIFFSVFFSTRCFIIFLLVLLCFCKGRLFSIYLLSPFSFLHSWAEMSHDVSLFKTDGLGASRGSLLAFNESYKTYLLVLSARIMLFLQGQITFFSFCQKLKEWGVIYSVRLVHKVLLWMWNQFYSDRWCSTVISFCAGNYI